MANKSLFNTKNQAITKLPEATATNNAGGKAYLTDEKRTLAQIAATNCFNGTFYASASDNLKLAQQAALALKDDPEFIAKVALYSRNKSYMKDMPAFLTVVLAGCENNALFRHVFRSVIDNGKMLRNVIQMARSGAVNGKVYNMSSAKWRGAIQEWFNSRSTDSIFRASIGNDPSMKDIMSMAHPKPNTVEKAALFKYMFGNEVSIDELPETVASYERFKKDKSLPVPDVDFRMLDSLGIDTRGWTEIAKRAGWTMTRMNLNTFARHGVFKDKEAVDIIATRLRDKEQIAKARCFPYQIFVAYMETQNSSDIPHEIKEALQDSMETAIDNIPSVGGQGVICVDNSGSMGSVISGYRGTASSKVNCANVAGLMASAFYRKNPNARIMTFTESARDITLNPRDTVFTNTKLISSVGGGTNISAPMQVLNKERYQADWVFYISDNESWADSRSYGRATTFAEEWAIFKKNNKNARLISCDLTPINTSQINKRPDVLKVGGWSDQAFEVVSTFIESGNSQDHWVSEIEKVSLSF